MYVWQCWVSSLSFVGDPTVLYVVQNCCEALAEFQDHIKFSQGCAVVSLVNMFSQGPSVTVRNFGGNE